MIRKLKTIWNWIFHRAEMRNGMAAVKSVTMTPGGIDATMQFPAVRVFAQELGKFYTSLGSKNYLELSLFDPATRRHFTIIIQDTARPTPGEINRVLRTALESIASKQAAAKVARYHARQALAECGYEVEEEQTEVQS